MTGSTLAGNYVLASAPADTILDPQRRLEQIKQCRSEWVVEDLQLKKRLQALDPQIPASREQGLQIVDLRRRRKFKRFAAPVELTPEIRQMGFKQVRSQLVPYFTRWSKTDRLLWLENFRFIVTPALREFAEAIASLRTERQNGMGQDENVILGEESGMGKSLFLEYICFMNAQQVEPKKNFVPVVKFDASEGNKAPWDRDLYHRITLEYGRVLPDLGERELFETAYLLINQCGTEVIIIDRAQNLQTPEMRRRVLELSNYCKDVTFICASTEPYRFTDGDPEIASRWQRSFILQPYTGERLQDLLVLIELLLPFTNESQLYVRDVKADSGKKETLPGPAQLIENWTGGNLKEITRLIWTASRQAILDDEPNIGLIFLTNIWKQIQNQRGVDRSN